MRVADYQLNSSNTLLGPIFRPGGYLLTGHPGWGYLLMGHPVCVS